MKRGLLCLALCAFPALAQAQPTNPITKTFVIGTGGDCTATVCASAVRYMCRPTTTSPNIYACNPNTLRYDTIIGGATGSSFGAAASSTITTTSSNVSVSGATPVLSITITARTTNGDRIYYSATAPATTSSAHLDPGDSITLDYLGGTQVSFLSASGTQGADIVITYL